MKYRLLVIANAGFIIGIIVGLYFSIGIILFLSIFVLGLALFLNLDRFFRIRNKIYRYLKVYLTKKVIIIFILFFILGFLALVFKEGKFENFLQDMAYIQNNNIKIYAVIISDKEEKEYSDLYRVKILNINNKKYYNTNCIVKLNKFKNEKLLYGDLIYFTGEFQAPQESTNYKGYDYKEYLKTINIYGTFKSKYSNVKILKENSYGIIQMLANKVKNSFERSIR